MYYIKGLFFIIRYAWRKSLRAAGYCYRCLAELDYIEDDHGRSYFCPACNARPVTITIKGQTFASYRLMQLHEALLLIVALIVVAVFVLSLKH